MKPGADGSQYLDLSAVKSNLLLHLVPLVPIEFKNQRDSANGKAEKEDFSYRFLTETLMNTPEDVHQPAGQIGLL